MQFSRNSQGILKKSKAHVIIKESRAILKNYVTKKMQAVTVIANAVLSRVILKESLPWQKAAGVLLALCGAVLIAVNAPAPQVTHTCIYIHSQK